MRNFNAKNFINEKAGSPKRRRHEHFSNHDIATCRQFTATESDTTVARRTCTTRLVSGHWTKGSPLKYTQNISPSPHQARAETVMKRNTAGHSRECRLFCFLLKLQNLMTVIEQKHQCKYQRRKRNRDPQHRFPASGTDFDYFCGRRSGELTCMVLHDYLSLVIDLAEV